MCLLYIFIFFIAFYGQIYPSARCMPPQPRGVHLNKSATIIDMSQRSQWQTQVVQTLARIQAARRQAQGPLAPELAQVQAYQRARLAHTYADFLAGEATAPAARFFLDELYCNVEVAQQRDADVSRIVPLMARVLPQMALDAVADALNLEALSAQLDYAMAQQHAAQGSANRIIDAPLYQTLYRQVGQAPQRALQLQLLERTGRTLAQAVRLPLIRPTLGMMEMPARAAGLTRLHSFLAHGLDAFKRLPDVNYFLSSIQQRETALMQSLLAEQ
jgi:hypothetical protein